MSSNASEPEAVNTEEEAAEILEDILVEEVSIDGMCGVY